MPEPICRCGQWAAYEREDGTYGVTRVICTAAEHEIESQS